MDKKEAIQFLREQLGEIPTLAGLPYNNDDYPLWRNKIEDVLKHVFNRDSDEYQGFVKAHPKRLRTSTRDRSAEKRWYIDEIKACEIALKSIIQKYEILGIEGESGKGGEVEKMDKKRPMDFLNEKMQEIYDLETSPPNNADFPIWCTTIEGFLFKVFGEGSWEYQTFKEAGMLRGMVEDEHTQYRKALKERRNALASIINTHEALGQEELLEQKDTIKLPLQLFHALQLHPKVLEASSSCFATVNYREAILNAFISLIDYIKEITGLDLDGDDLMNNVFSFNYDKEHRKITKYPMIRINELKNQTDRDEQHGFMFLCKGAAAFIRNPKAHKLIAQTDPLHTLEYLAFASLIFRQLDKRR